MVFVGRLGASLPCLGQLASVLVANCRLEADRIVSGRVCWLNKGHGFVDWRMHGPPTVTNQQHNN